MRLVQRFGQIDRIGSRNDKIQFISFWPDPDLDSYINLKARVELRMKAMVMTSTGDDNLLSPEEQGDLGDSKTHPALENSPGGPGGISTAAAAIPDAQPGVVFVLKKVHNEVNTDYQSSISSIKTINPNP